LAITRQRSKKTTWKVHRTAQSAISSENESLIASVFGYSPQMRMLNYLLDFPTNDFTKKEIIQVLGMSKQTFYKYFGNLERSEIVKVTRSIGKTNLHKANKTNPMVKTITDFEKKLSLQIAVQQERNIRATVTAT
jgi:Fic family protein